jgi:protein-tyrosine kinase
MSRIYDALKKAEQEARGAAVRPPAGDEPAAPPSTADMARAEGNWGIVPPEALKELSTVRRVLESRVQDRSRFAVGVVSSVAGEGATTVLLGFARTLVVDARLRILLVDADDEGRELSRVWGQADAAGWTNLASPGQVAGAIVRTSVANLDLLPYGSRLEMSGAQAGEFLIEAARVVAQQYDYVLFDCGSILGTPTSRYLTGAMDGVLMVVHASGTRREICQKAVAELQKAQATILGVILNRRRYLIPEAIYKRI